jgi:hypothetical protein
MGFCFCIIPANGIFNLKVDFMASLTLLTALGVGLTIRTDLFILDLFLSDLG